MGGNDHGLDEPAMARNEQDAVAIAGGALDADARACTRCQSLVCSRSQVVLPTPAGKLLAVGEAPGAEEDARGEGFVGAAGRTLDRLLAAHGLKRGIDYGVANIVRCRPPDNRKPTAAEVDACLPYLAETLAAHKPRVLLLVGASAAQAFLGRGALYEQILASRQAARPDPARAHPALASALQALEELRLVPMPHTSGLVWNRRAPDGRLWREWGREQVDLAADLWRGDGKAY